VGFTQLWPPYNTFLSERYFSAPNSELKRATEVALAIEQSSGGKFVPIPLHATIRRDISKEMLTTLCGTWKLANYGRDTLSANAPIPPKGDAQVTIRLKPGYTGVMGETKTFRLDFKWSYSDGKITLFFNDWHGPFPREQVRVLRDDRGYYFDYADLELRKGRK
jgi:hypothetical protein